MIHTETELIVTLLGKYVLEKVFSYYYCIKYNKATLVKLLIIFFAKMGYYNVTIGYKSI